jgi:hypothetical protein
VLENEGGWFIKRYYNGSLIRGNSKNSCCNNLALQALYPEHRWITYNRFAFGHSNERDEGGSKAQATLFRTLRNLLSDHVVLTNYTLLYEGEMQLAPNERGLKQYEYDVSFYTNQDHFYRKKFPMALNSLLTITYIYSKSCFGF